VLAINNHTNFVAFSINESNNFAPCDGWAWMPCQGRGRRARGASLLHATCLRKVKEDKGF